jgi:hypothetical protein
LGQRNGQYSTKLNASTPLEPRIELSTMKDHQKHQKPPWRCRAHFFTFSAVNFLIRLRSFCSLCLFIMVRRLRLILMHRTASPIAQRLTALPTALVRETHASRESDAIVRCTAKAAGAAAVAVALPAPLQDAAVRATQRTAPPTTRCMFGVND